jgi:DNA-binding CsgD family transcriptional regulator
MRFKDLIVYGIIAAGILMLLKGMEFSIVLGSIKYQIWIAIGAIAFIFLGVFISTRLSIQKRENGLFALNEKKAEDFALSKREQEVLNLLAQGMSNQEIADELFVSVPTVKTHISNIYEKLDVKRRTQAIQIALESGLLTSHT